MFIMNCSRFSFERPLFKAAFEKYAFIGFIKIYFISIPTAVRSVVIWADKAADKDGVQQWFGRLVPAHHPPPFMR